MLSAKTLKRTLVVAIATAMVVQGTVAEDHRNLTRQYVKQRVQTLSVSGGRQVGPAHIAAVKFIKDFYAARDYQPAWTSTQSIAELRQAIHDSWTDGLRPIDFHAGPLGIDVRGEVPTLTPIEREIIRTDAYVRLLYQLYFGKVDPEKIDPKWNFKRRLPSGDAVAIISEAIETGDVGELIQFARPKDPAYSGLRQLLKRMQSYVDAGGWPKISQGGVLKLGDSDARIPVLRKRLSISGDFRPDNKTVAPNLYDQGLQQAVKIFQTRTGIDADGIIGPATIKALNITASERVDQIRVNLERARWILPALEKQRDLIVVNIAGFYLWLFLDGKFVWATDVITGKPYHKTPVFTEMMRYIVLNPDWTVPRSIIRNEIFPKAKANPAFLSARHYQLISSDGKKIAPSSLNWGSATANTFPYRVVQQPGPWNALGLVKFIFPNRYNVYLHDTPSRQLFSKTGRAFSHGCIRVKDPLKLAELLLGYENKWTRADIDQVIASGKQRRVNLKKPLKVAILYWTVDTGQNGEIFFHQDVYGRDARILKALNAKFRFD